MTSEILVQEAPRKACLQTQLVLLKGHKVFWTNKIVLAKQYWVLTRGDCIYAEAKQLVRVDLENFSFFLFF